MSSNQLFGGSICISDILDQMKNGHSSFTKSAKNQKIYCNILVWLNDEKDEYGNDMSLQLSSTKDKREQEGKIYFGNTKRLETTKPISAKDIPDTSSYNIPVREKQTDKPVEDDLPF